MAIQQDIPADTTRSPVNRGVVFAIVAMTLLMMTVDSTIVATVLHALQHDLDTSVNWAGWTLTAYSLGFVLMLPISGKLSEHFGRRRVFMASVVTFTLASLACGLADNIALLIALRALQAAGGAGFTPSATGIIVDHFGDQRDRAVSLFGSIFPIGAMIGPIFGGFFVTYWSWRGVFFVNLPIGLLVLVLARRFIPPDPTRLRDAGFRMDLPGMALLGLGLFGGMLAAGWLGEPEAGPRSAGVLVAAPLAVAAIVLFFRHIARTSRPFIAPRLIGGPDFGAVNLVNVIYGGSIFGAMSLVPLYAANRYGLGAFDAGTLLIAQGLATVAFSVAAAFALRRTGHRLPIRVGGAVIAAGLGLLALAPPWGLTPYAWLGAAAFLVGAGSGIINPACRNAGLQLAPRQASTLAALRSMFLQIGSILTVSVTTAILGASAHPGAVHAVILAGLAAVLLAAMPLVSRVPEHHGAW